MNRLDSVLGLIGNYQIRIVSRNRKVVFTDRDFQSRSGLWMLRDLELILEAIGDIVPKYLSFERFREIFGPIRIMKLSSRLGSINNIRSFAPPGVLSRVYADIVLTDAGREKLTPSDWAANYKYIIAHELGHLWDYRAKHAPSRGLMRTLGTWQENALPWKRWDPYRGFSDPVNGQTIYPEPAPGTYLGCPPGPPDPNHSDERFRRPPYASTYGGTRILTAPGAEDWAESFACTIYPDFYPRRGRLGLVFDGVRQRYVQGWLKGGINKFLSIVSLSD
jgi:hypothetical protein